MARRRGQMPSRICTLLFLHPFFLLLFLTLLQVNLAAISLTKPAFLAVIARSSYSSLSSSFSATAGPPPLYPSRYLLTTSASRNTNDDDDLSPPPLLSRRELFVPALLALGSATLLLSNTIQDIQRYDETHKQLFAMLASAPGGEEGGRGRQEQHQQPRRLRVLEIGVGEGVNVKYYPLGCEVIGLDPHLKREALSVAQVGNGGREGGG